MLLNVRKFSGHCNRFAGMTPKPPPCIEIEREIRLEVRVPEPRAYDENKIFLEGIPQLISFDFHQ